MKTRRRLLPIAAAIALSHAIPAHAFFDSLISAIASSTASAAMGSKLTQGQPVPAQQAAQNSAAAAKVLQVSQAFKAIRTDKDMDSIFSRGQITGKEAMTELKAIKGAVHGAGVQGAMSQLMGFDSSELGANAEQQQAAQFMSLFSNLSSGNFSDAALDMLITNVSTLALEQFFTQLTENPKFLEEETVQLPATTVVIAPHQRQRVLVLATALIAVKGSNKIMEASKNDYARTQQGFQRLIEKREKAAGVLAAAIDAWRLASEEKKELEARKLEAYLSKDDMEFLAGFTTEQQLKDFAKDFTTQNIALEYLRKKGDFEYKDYKAEADEYVSNINAHLRKTVGLGSMLGFSALFLKEGKRAIKQEGAASMLTVLPFADQFISEVGKTASDGLPNLVGGVMNGLFGDDEFRIEKADGSVVKKGTGASGVISFLTGEEVGSQFINNLYRDDNNGYLYRANLCNNSAAGMLDKTVPGETKKAFVKGFYKLDEASEFTFRNAFEGSFQSKRKNELISSLLSTDQRGKDGNETQQAVREVQKVSEQGLSKLDSRDVAQIIFASSVEGPITHARLKLGDYTVRMIPSQWMVYEYENYQQNCLKDVTARIKASQTAPAAPAKGSKKKS